MILTDTIGLTGMAFAFASILTQLLCANRTWSQYFFVLLTLMFFALLPVGSYLSLAAYLRGYFGDLSIVSLFLLVIMFCQIKFRQNMQSINIKRNHLLWLVSMIALIFYPFALGLSTIDPYRLGFGNIYFLASLFFLSLLFWYIQEALIVWGILFAVLAWLLKLIESTNLWDYLLDPWLVIYAFFSVFKQLNALRSTQKNC